MKTKTQLTVGSRYLQGTFAAGVQLSARLVQVTKIDATEYGWYDDHQGGGQQRKGSVWFVYMSTANASYAADVQHGFASLEYAEDHWISYGAATDKELAEGCRADVLEDVKGITGRHRPADILTALAEIYRDQDQDAIQIHPDDYDGCLHKLAKRLDKAAEIFSR